MNIITNLIFDSFKKMKIFFFLFSFLLLNQTSFPQDFNTVFFNSEWEMTSQKSAVFFRKSGFNDSFLTYDGKITDYYINGNLEMTGQYQNGLKEGEFIYYDQNHNVILNSSYEQNKRSGTWTEYYSNGIIKKQVKYEDNKEKMIAINDENGKTKIVNPSKPFSMVYYYDPTLETYTYESAGKNEIKYYLQGKLLNGFKDGIWTVRDDYRTICKVKYNNGNFVDGEYFLDQNVKTKILSDIFTFLILEPAKINITESFFKEQGQMIKLNYVLKAIQDYERKAEGKVKLDNETDLFNYFNSQYSIYLKNCSDTFRIEIHLTANESGNITIDSIGPKISTSMRDEVHRVLNTISNLKYTKNKKFILYYRVLCIDELDYKK